MRNCPKAATGHDYRQTCPEPSQSTQSRSRKKVRPSVRALPSARCSAGEPSPRSIKGLTKDRRRRREDTATAPRAGQPLAQPTPSPQHPSTKCQCSAPSPPPRRGRAQRLGRLAPLHVDRGVAPARRPRLAPAFAWRWECRTDRGDPRCFIALEGGRSFVHSDAGEADAEPTT